MQGHHRKPSPLPRETGDISDPPIYRPEDRCEDGSDAVSARSALLLLALLAITGVPILILIVLAIAAVGLEDGSTRP